MKRPKADGNFDAIQREAFERYVLDLAQRWAAEHDRLYGDNESVLIRHIELRGEYPNTGLKIQTYDKNRELEQSSVYVLWGRPDFFDAEGNLLVEPERLVADILMLARGG